MSGNQTVFILSASSDIGYGLMERYLDQGAQVIGTYRNLGSLEKLKDHPRAQLIHLDLDSPGDIEKAASFMKTEQLNWDLFIAANGTMEPIGPFMDVDGETWQQSIVSNALMPCRLVQALYPFRRISSLNSVCLLAGGGTNNPFRNYSAYCLSKILLIKMCELLDDENPDLKSFILGPGYVRTKIHDETLKAGQNAGDNHQKTLEFFGSEGTPLDDIFDCIEWCVSQKRDAVSGRNFSVVHDPWRNGGLDLVSALTKDKNLYKLRRSGNN
jgi:NAD(P)-dependent dehydrogenase (short-subunit alcohol dehydrogenase family)